MTALARSGIHPYATTAYAGAFHGQADHFLVDEWQTAVLQREIPETDAIDACGAYPLAALGAGADLAAGLRRLAVAGHITVALVSDPLTGPRPGDLAAAFPICRPFKTHYIVDRLASPTLISKHHRYEIRRAERECEMAIVDFGDHLKIWSNLYQGVAERRGMRGLTRFSPHYFRALAGMPALTAFAAYREGIIVAMALWMAAGDVAYYHLAASNEQGYRSAAAYGLLAAAMDHYAAVPRLHLGGAAGIAGADDSGLARFKRGFANNTADAYFCGAILDEKRYAALCQGRPRTDFFPAYRG